MIPPRSFGRVLLSLASALAIPWTLAGCGSSDQMKKQVAGLEKQILAMRADEDRLEERLAQLELSSRKEPASADARGREEGGDRVERPRLKVIHVTPDAPPADEAPLAEPAPADAAAKRPVIRGTGDRVIKMFDAESRGAPGGEKPLAAMGRPRGG